MVGRADSDLLGWLVAAATAAALGCGPEALKPGEGVDGVLTEDDLSAEGLAAEGIDIGDIALAIEQTTGATVDLSDPGRRYEIVYVEVPAQSTARVQLSSNIYDPLLAVADLGGAVLTANDDFTDLDAVVDVENRGPSAVLVRAIVTTSPFPGNPLLGAFYISAR